MNLEYCFDKEKINFIPTYQISYWLSDAMLSIFKNGEPIAKLFDVKKGADTGDNSKYLRFWWEVKSISFYAFSNSKKWVPYAKGGEFRRWYGNKEYVIYWDNNGYELNHSKANLRSPQMYFKKTITWSAISSGKSSFRVNDAMGLFDSAGSSMLPNNDIFDYVLAVMNSKVATIILDNINPTLNYGAGSIGLFPLLKISNPTVINSLTASSVKISKQDWDSFETSWDFKKHPLI